ncbi:hypothetical protein L3X38_023949 [Prunus dulcis]|uniref:Uncharacterized protein n=1 Tax=Prunus dulcis TaxID=3755 RepID=A0AAD4Z4Z5_PRUDU|nr:hypothetical protein L3X38_023949 [Prunus dulcis]
MHDETATLLSCLSASQFEHLVFVYVHDLLGFLPYYSPFIKFFLHGTDCLVLLLFGTSIFAPGCYGASIVAHAFAGVFLLWSMLPPLMLCLLASLSVDVVVALPFAFASTVLTGFVFCLIYCRAHRVSVSVFCLIYLCAHRVFVFCLSYCRAHRVSVFCLIYCNAHRVSVFCLTYCHAYRVSVFCLTYCRAYRVSVFCLTYYRAHRVSMFYYVPYFLRFAIVCPLRTLL